MTCLPTDLAMAVVFFVAGVGFLVAGAGAFIGLVFLEGSP